ncbi:hypothetical protein HPB48_008763 [Haemaphysalis longicornis]|uniref:Uncharacterized protein n=1 Tax=Haemaphysalis longicornis TaxID=44386 RepID=A0A9J6GDP9_HAELO|nr:hypothetical protein HPB48_008763 [Haemaphysalis longicornis]
MPTSQTWWRTRPFIMFGCWCTTLGMFFHRSTRDVMRTSWVPRFALLALKIVQFPFNVYVLRRIGSRLSLVYSMAALSVIAGYRGQYAVDSGVTVSWLLVFEFTVTTLYAYSAALYPTVVRGAGVGLCYVSGRMGAIAGPFLNDVYTLHLRGVAYSVAAVLLLLFARLAFSLPETTRLPLANTIRGLKDKWNLRSPLRLARSKEANRGGSKSGRSRSIVSKTARGGPAAARAS